MSKPPSVAKAVTPSMMPVQGSASAKAGRLCALAEPGTKSPKIT
jgi:hypothetical protein